MFTKGSKNRTSAKTAQEYARMCGLVGIGLNILLFFVKFICGMVSGSVSIQADAINNLTDVAVAAITLAGFLVAGMGAGTTHPFGHGRFEWITGLFSSMVVIMFGGKLAMDSVSAIVHPSTLVMNGWIILTLICAIVVKAVMYYYNHKIGEKIQSVSMKATAVDSISDMVSTLVILVSVVVQAKTGIHLDGWGGLAVSLFILYSGMQAMGEGIVRILGKNTNQEMKQDIEQMVLEYKDITGISEFYVHDYGMGHSAISMHIEGNDANRKEVLTTEAQEISYKIYKKYGCEAVVQVDILDGSKEAYDRIQELTKAVFSKLQVKAYLKHLKVIPMENHTLVAMEIAYEHREREREEVLRQSVAEALKIINPDYKVMIKVVREVMVERSKSLKSLFTMNRKVC